MFCRLIGWRLCWLALLAALAGFTPVRASGQDFPFDTELLLDANPMRGSKRVPSLAIGPKGETTIDLWCNSVQAQLVVAEDTVTILVGAKTDRQCETARVRADDDLLAALQDVASWRWQNEVLVLKGAREVRFRRSTH